MKKHILVYADSLSWGIIPGTRQRLPFDRRWPGVMENSLLSRNKQVRVIEDCLNGRRTVWEDPFKPGRNGAEGLAQRIEINAPLALVILMLGTNDFQSTHHFNAWHSAQGIATLINIVRSAPIEPGMPVAPILVVAPPPFGAPSGTSAKFAGAVEKSVGLAAAYAQVCQEQECAFFDAGAVIATSVVDGVHLDAEQHGELGMALADKVETLL